LILNVAETTQFLLRRNMTRARLDIIENDDVLSKRGSFSSQSQQACGKFHSPSDALTVFINGVRLRSAFFGRFFAGAR